MPDLPNNLCGDNLLERRLHQRHPIALSALVHPNVGRSWLCTIRDFCEVGMLLTGAGGSRALTAASPELRSGTKVSIHFSVATPTGQKHFRSPAEVARVLDSGNGMGLQFTKGLPGDAYEALTAFAVASGMAQKLSTGDDGSATDDGDKESKSSPDVLDKEFLRDKRINKKHVGQVVKRLQRMLERLCTRVSEQLFERTDSHLLVKARDAGTDAVQMMYFEGLELLEKNRQNVQKAFTANVLAQVKSVADIDEVLNKRRKRQSGTSSALALVDTEQFEDWLAIAEVISKAENRYSDTLFDIRMRLGMLAQPWSHKDIVPVGPAVISWAFDDAIGDLEFRRQIKQDIYQCFEASLIPLLDGLYSAINTFLDELSFFPPLGELKNQFQRSILRPTPSGAKPNPAAYQELEAGAREAVMAADGLGNMQVDHNPFAETTNLDAYSSARKLLSLKRNTRSLLGQTPEVKLAGPDAPPEERFNTQDLLGAMAQIETELGDAPLSDSRLKPRLVEVLRERYGDVKSLTEGDYDNLDVMENLVDAMREDRLITQGIRDWIHRLEMTLNKLATTDPGFLARESNDPHSAVEMLNQLARLGNSRDSRDGIDRELGRRVDELLERVVTEYDANPEVFSEVVSELNPLVDQQSKAYRGNIERTVRTSEGQQKLARARREVLAELTTRIDGKEVPELLLQLINPGWRNLLVHAHLRYGRGSIQWRDGLALIDQLSGQLMNEIEPGSEAYLEPELLLTRVVDGLNSISFDPSKRTPLVMRMSDVLIGDTTGEKAPVRKKHVAAGTTAEAVGLEGLLPDTSPDIESEDEELQQDWSQALERARRIQVGEWLATSDAKGHPLILTVAFIGDEYGVFVLVNRKGIRVRELSLKDMSDGLHTGEITLLDDYDLPLMERASQRMLQNMHNQLAFQASHDELTQLLNRKEFERTIQKNIQVARAQSIQHALLYLDMDQFKIINNTSGHTAGDELLKIIGHHVRDILASDFTVEVARLGGDEFGALLLDVETQAARDAANQLLASIREKKFEWEGRHYSLSASIGLVFIDEGTESVDSALRHADEACYTAKDAGRNRVQEYELGDTKMMQRHGVMEWVTQLDEAIENERLVLKCQRIVPIGNSTGESHYEILLSMRDHLGDLMPPADFILAAETYNRMTIVDRWVIEKVLNWMAVQRDRLDMFGGFSINVSGHSVNDETFPDFVLEQFSKTQAPTGKVCFEITETAAIGSLDNAVDFMNRMKIIGCRFSLDDFGTGLSSYSYLRNLPVDYVKIDGVFVKDIVDNPGDYAVVRSINEIGHYMGKQTIAEYVESDAILKLLEEIGVDYAQGYGIEKPMALEDLRI